MEDHRVEKWLVSEADVGERCLSRLASFLISNKKQTSHMAHRAKMAMHRRSMEINGRNNLIQQKNMAMLAQQMQLAMPIMPGKVSFSHMPMFSVTPSLATNASAAAAAAAAAAFNPYLGPVSPGLMPAEILTAQAWLLRAACCAVRCQRRSSCCFSSGRTETPPNRPTGAMHYSCVYFQVCREYQRGNCSRGETDCRFAHPADSTMIDPSDNTVTVCMDYIKGRCSRDKCKYFHPPAHLQAKIKAAQHQVNQATAAAAMLPLACLFVRIEPCDVLPSDDNSVFFLFLSCLYSLLHIPTRSPFPPPPFPVVLSEQGIPHSVMPPLPKRPALEKANGATSMFSAGMLQYQQALANMQFQQQAAFIPSGRASRQP
ncbi:hypothetical protein cypCar_00019327 [Cyprinus carpio]|nr:hypothetical protein cypCar_00019327 [Cyprinus carpio]